MQTWGLTDPGNIRQQNQDSYAIVPFAHHEYRSGPQ